MSDCSHLQHQFLSRSTFIIVSIRLCIEMTMYRHTALSRLSDKLFHLHLNYFFTALDIIYANSVRLILYGEY